MPAKDGLKDALARWNDPFSRYDHFRVPRSKEAAKQVQRLLGDFQVAPPTAADLQQTHHDVVALWEDEGSLESLTQKVRKRVPWILFFPRGRSSEWLGADREFAHSFLILVRTKPLASVVGSMVIVFLRDYPTNIATFDFWRQGIQALVLKSELTRLRCWSERARELGIFKPDGPHRMATFFAEIKRDGSSFLEEFGFGGVLGDAAFLEKCCVQLWRETEARLEDDQLDREGLDRHLSLLTSRGDLRFPHHRGALADALLRPFVSQDGSGEIAELVKEQALQHLGDPRVEVGKWSDASEDARDVMLRWLVEATLADFFRIFDKTAKGHHWKERKAFWMNYARQGVIAEAWIVLGPEALEVARWALKNGGRDASRLDGSGDRYHSVLLMRIGELVIAEWSHNGKCRFFAPDNPKTPKFYRRSYQRRQLMDEHATVAIAHHQNWQYRFSPVVQRYTGVRRR